MHMYMYNKNNIIYHSISKNIIIYLYLCVYIYIHPPVCLRKISHCGNSSANFTVWGCLGASYWFFKLAIQWYKTGWPGDPWNLNTLADFSNNTGISGHVKALDEIGRLTYPSHPKEWNQNLFPKAGMFNASRTSFERVQKKWYRNSLVSCSKIPFTQEFYSS